MPGGRRVGGWVEKRGSAPGRRAFLLCPIWSLSALLPLLLTRNPQEARDGRHVGVEGLHHDGLVQDLGGGREEGGGGVRPTLIGRASPSSPRAPLPACRLLRHPVTAGAGCPQTRVSPHTRIAGQGPGSAATGARAGGCTPQARETPPPPTLTVSTMSPRTVRLRSRRGGGEALRPIRAANIGEGTTKKKQQTNHRTRVSVLALACVTLSLSCARTVASKHNTFVSSLSAE